MRVSYNPKGKMFVKCKFILSVNYYRNVLLCVLTVKIFMSILSSNAIDEDITYIIMENITKNMGGVDELQHVFVI